jgi:hypothetical protein
MKKKVVKIGGSSTIGISFDKNDREFYGIEPGDFVLFNIDKIVKMQKGKAVVKYDRKQFENHNGNGKT